MYDLHTLGRSGGASRGYGWSIDNLVDERPEDFGLARDPVLILPGVTGAVPMPTAAGGDLAQQLANCRQALADLRTQNERIQGLLKQTEAARDLHFNLKKQFEAEVIALRQQVKAGGGNPAALAQAQANLAQLNKRVATLSAEKAELEKRIREAQLVPPAGVAPTGLQAAFMQVRARIKALEQQLAAKKC